jgi:DNA-binding transcriptional MerR regulator
MTDAGPSHLSIGEVLGLLLEEFPDVTISKIRFLESQGLIEPERTPSGYRKFYDHDVELLRVILREQRENFLPLRVIKDRIDSGQLDPTPPRGERKRSAADDEELAKEIATHPSAARSAPVPAGAAWARLDQRPGGADPDAPDVPDATGGATRPPEPVVAPAAEAAHERSEAGRAGTLGGTASSAVLPGVLLNRDELCAMAGVTAAELGQLEEYGVVARRTTGTDLYGEDAVEIASCAVGLLRAGVDARHLRAWRNSVEREAGLFEQLVLPLMRHRNPQARGQITSRLEELDEMSVRLRAALMRASLRRYFDR